MHIELWTDIICPWCGLGSHQLDQALTRFGKERVTLTRKSFQLDERAPVGSSEPVRTMLRQKKGMSDAQIDAIGARIEQLAAAQGLSPYHVIDNRSGNTSLAHELAAWATERGKGDEVWAALYRAHFAERRSIFELDALVALAVDVGLPADEAREVLSARRYQAQVLAEGREARELGSSGVPFVVVNRRYAVAGAQPVEVFLEMLERAAQDEAQNTPEGEVCSPDGCD